jgi:flagellar hook-associated protein 2
MGTIISSGVGSGLNVQELVGQLVQAEGQPQTQRLDLAEAKAQAKLSALASLRSALSTFRGAVDQLKDLEAFRGRQVALTSTDFISATATTSAAPGSYAIEVERLASAHRLASQAFATADTAVGTGTLRLARGGAAFDLQITSENSTLAGIAAAINDADGNPGIVATILTGVDGARLILRSTETGATSNLVVTQTGGDGGLAALTYDPANSIANLTEIDPAQDARVLIDTFAVESPTNTISGAIPGLDISLLDTNAVGETTTLAIEYDEEGARAMVGKLVESYNALIDAVASVASYDAETKTAGPLFADAGLRNIVFQLRRELGRSLDGLDGPFQNLSQIGIGAELDGKLSLDTTRLNAAFATGFDAIGQLFSDSENGLAVRLNQMLEPYLASGGVLDGRNDTLKATIEDIADRRESLSQRLASLEQRLFRQFNALDTLLAQMQTTSNYLSQQLASLPRADSLLRGNNN